MNAENNGANGEENRESGENPESQTMPGLPNLGLALGQKGVLLLVKLPREKRRG